MNGQPIIDIEAQRMDAPESPKPHYVYICRHESGAALYIGASSRVLERLAEHQHGSTWFEHVKQIDIERHESREVALRREKHLIGKSGTVLNVQHVDPLAAFFHLFRTYKYRMSLFVELFGIFTPSTQAAALAKCAALLHKKLTEAKE